MRFNKLSRTFLSNRQKRKPGTCPVFRFPACQWYRLHPADFVSKHPLDFVAHGFVAGGAKMDCHSVGGFFDFLHKRRRFVPLHVKKGHAVGDSDIGGVFVAHKQLLSRKKKDLHP